MAHKCEAVAICLSCSSPACQASCLLRPYNKLPRVSKEWKLPLHNLHQSQNSQSTYHVTQLFCEDASNLEVSKMHMADLLHVRVL